MQLSDEEARRRFAAARVLRLATADGEGHPHVVPATFALKNDTVVIAVDHKPKKHQNLKRLRNIAANNAVSALADLYDEDWTQLWWVRADGTAQVIEAGADEHAESVGWLRQKYPQYREHLPTGPVIRIAVARWAGWSYLE